MALLDFHNSKIVPSIDTNMFQNTNSTFKVLVPAALYSQWKSATNWFVIASQIKPWGFVFVAKEANSTVKIQAVGSAPSLDLEYSTDGSTWNAYTVGDTITLASIGSQVSFRAGTNGNAKFGQDAANYNKFVLTGSVDCFGSMDFLLSEDHEATDALPSFCYYGLFKDCTALKSAPELPGTNLGEHCYQSMFEGCTGLETAPELPATTLAAACYGEMFRNASTLNYVKIGYTGNFSTTYFNDWLYGVASEGDVAYDGTDTTRGPSAIPVGWNGFRGLVFTALEANSTVSMAKSGSAPTVSLEYSTDDGLTWSPFTVGTTTVTLANVDDKMYLRATSTNKAMAASWNTNYNYFVMTGQIAASGNINSLLNGTDPNAVTTAPEYAYPNLFNGCTALVDAIDLMLPSTTASQNCYGHGMFRNCTNLVGGPTIMATNLLTGSYTAENMFNGCSSLASVKIYATGSDWNMGNTQNWMSGVPSTGTFYYNGTNTSRGVSYIPEGWTITQFTFNGG